ncbi:ATP-binding protein [Longibaculum muris]|uniref:ATP-binding protein n=1 Tax=Longibaculum muris TaxID=1796628 RepID=UPI0022E692B5|nr:ATP-binding protein [Longibaculum muris]
MLLDHLIIYRHLTKDADVEKCLSFIEDESLLNEEDFIATMLTLAERYDLHGHLFQSLLTYLLTHHENSFTLSLERKQPISEALKEVIMNDLQMLYQMYHFDFSKLNPLYKDLFIDFPHSKPIINQEIYDLLTKLQIMLSKSTSVAEFYEILYNHYRQYGVGKYGLNKAFRYLDNEIIPIEHIGNNTLEQLIGYESQKERLKANTEAFLNGRKANNVLLYGDSGTGKSSSIKALLNEYYKDGLRMVEVYKHQFIALPQIINELQNRQYRFIIFMDDLSFEEFEVEYKYLKAVIEGGLEKKPENILIYATSNRRHLIKETWNDRNHDQEINNNDAKQEKLSLVSRFGVQIMYIHPDKQHYLDIIDGLASAYHLDMDEDELHDKALQWEIRNGGFSGRTAKQFIHMLLGKK